MSKRQQIAALIVGGILIIILLVLIKINSLFSSPSQLNIIIDEKTGKLSVDNNIKLTNVDGSIIEEALANIKIPEKGDQVSQGLKDIIAIPIEATPATLHEEGPSQTRYTLEAHDNKFTPVYLLVKANDLVTIEIMAQDKDYDFVVPAYGLNKKIKQGELGIVAFAADQIGEFDYYCGSCGGLESSANGKLIIR